MGLKFLSIRDISVKIIDYLLVGTQVENIWYNISKRNPQFRLNVIMMTSQAAPNIATIGFSLQMVTDQNIDGNTCLSLAVENGHFEIVKLCLEKREHYLFSHIA